MSENPTLVAKTEGIQRLMSIGILGVVLTSAVAGSRDLVTPHSGSRFFSASLGSAGPLLQMGGSHMFPRVDQDAACRSGGGSARQKQTEERRHKGL